MNIIGFDFGTTNSTISFYNQETKTLDCFQMHAGSTEYIPTVIAYKDGDVSIGDIAKKNMTKRDLKHMSISSFVWVRMRIRLSREKAKVRLK